MSRRPYSENALVEQPAMALFAELGWETADCYHETYGPQGTLGRETSSEVVLLARLVPALQRLNRGIAKQLNEEELALFDLLTRPEPRLNRREREEVKAVARQLLDTLKAERLVLDWRKRQQTRAGVQVAIRDTLDNLPDVYNDALFQQKCQLVYQHVYDSYFGAGRSIYATGAV